MNTKTKHGCRRVLAMLLVLISVISLFSIPAFAGQEDGYHDPAERWMNASNRTNELDVNATVTRETFHCYICKQPNLRDLNNFSDMEKTHWAYYAVMEAANAHIATFDEKEAWSK